MPKRKLIEVALPLDEINRQSAREKSIRKGHPSTLYLWWSRKPTATARAVLFSQLVDDLSEHYDSLLAAAENEGFDDPAAEASRRVESERRRLFRLIERMVDWDNLSDEDLWRETRREIRESCGDRPPVLLDPFAGGGSIPLEAQRLGLKAEASDLNPVAVLINKSLIEIPTRFSGRPPVNSDVERMVFSWPGASGLAEDVRSYGRWMRDEAEARIGHLYPKARLEDGTEATVIAWIWARTVTCPNPACGIDAPLTSKWWLGKKKGKEAYIVPTVVDGKAEYMIGHDPKKGLAKDEDGTINRGSSKCISSGMPIDNQTIRSQAVNRGLGSALVAVVAEGRRSRQYLPPTEEHIRSSFVLKPERTQNQTVPEKNHDVDRLPMYGMRTWAEAFTNRQLVALTTFLDLVAEARERVLADAVAAGMQAGERLEAGGSGAEAYADAVAAIFSLALPLDAAPLGRIAFRVKRREFASDPVVNI